MSRFVLTTKMCPIVLNSFYGRISETHDMRFPHKKRIRYAGTLIGKPMNEARKGGFFFRHPRPGERKMMRGCLSSTFFIDVEDIHPKTWSYYN